MRSFLRSLAWSALACGLVCCCGCIIVPIPHVNHIGPIGINAPRDEVRAFLLKGTHDWCCFGYRDRGSSLKPVEPILLTDRLAHASVTVDRATYIPAPDGFGQRLHTRSFFLYRPGYRVFVAENGEGATAATWTPAETVEEQEAIVDSLLSLDGATPWDHVVRQDNLSPHVSPSSPAWIFRPGENQCVPAVVPEPDNEPAKPDRRTCRIMAFAAGEYQRILDLALQAPDGQLFLPDDCWPALLTPEERHQEYNRRIAEKYLPPAERRRLIIKRLRAKVAFFRRQ